MNTLLALNADFHPATRTEARPCGGSARALDALAKSYSFAVIERAAEAGKSVIWGGYSWDSPLIYACDTIPVSYDQLWAEESRKSEAIARGPFPGAGRVLLDDQGR